MKPKITIFKVKEVKINNWNKVKYVNQTCGTFALDEDNIYSFDRRKRYPLLNIKTEKQLARFIYERFGEGKYRVMAHKLKGKSPLYTFWRGIINSDGFTFFKKEYNKREIEEIDRDLLKAGDEDEKTSLEEHKNQIKQEELEKTRKKKYGFSPYLRPSGNRGSQIFWNDPEPQNPEIYEEGEARIRGGMKGKRYKEGMSLRELNQID